jgi:predicted DNA-binding transcriptional regulator YafY
VLALIVSRLANLGRPQAAVDPAAVRTQTVRDEEERWLSIVEDAVAKKVPVKLRYFTASRGREAWRHASVHRVDLGPRPQFIATCHTANALRRFRLSNVLEARLDRGEAHREAAPGALRRFDEESFGGFRGEGPPVPCTFVVRDPASAWVARNLPDERVVEEGVPGGSRFRIETNAVEVLARFVVGLGDAATAETPELASAVAALARGALRTS